jgi:hypothetical protein
MKNKLTVFLDALGRTIIGTYSSETNDKLFVKNPVIVHVLPSQETPGQMSVQLLPIFFREFLQNKNNNVSWGFVRSNIVESDDLELEAKLVSQYEQVFAEVPATAASSESESSE